MEDFKPTAPQAFACQDAQLAKALLAAGCTLAPFESGGPCRMKYTPGFMRSRKHMPSKSVSLREFHNYVKQAFAKKIPGIITYYIVRDEKFTKAIKAWDDMVNSFAEAHSRGEEQPFPELDPELAMRCYYVLRASNQNLERSGIEFILSPILDATSSQSTEFPVEGKPGNGTRTAISGKIWTLGLPDEELRKLGIV